MKKFYIKDGVQIFLAIALTGSMAFAMTPTNNSPEPQKTASASVEAKKTVNDTSDKKKAATEPQTKPKAKKQVTWKDNPNKCNQDTQYISAEPPFKCIDKATKTNPSAEPVTTKSQPAFVPSGNRESWLKAAGIPQSDWGYVDYIVSRESGWDPCAYYPGQSNCNIKPVNACGLVQQNPCHKIPGDWRDPVIALKWQKSYVCQAKFNGYAGNSCYARAVSYWKANGNY